MLRSKIVVGTANFGLDYGIRNSAGKLTDPSIADICEVAERNGITTFDTAQGYGDAETRLRNKAPNKADIITKISIDQQMKYKPGDIKKKIDRSLSEAKQKQYYGVLIHQPELFYRSDVTKIISELNALKREKLIKKIGVSIYSPSVLELVMKNFKPDIVQVPFNIFDQRISQSGWAKILFSMGVELHARSAFLQGLLLEPQTALPTFAKERYSEIFSTWFDYQRHVGLPADYLALKFVLQQHWLSKVVVGIDSAKQLQRLIEIELSEDSIEINGFNFQDEGLLNPFNWK